MGLCAGVLFPSTARHAGRGVECSQSARAQLTRARRHVTSSVEKFNASVRGGDGVWNAMRCR